MDWWTSILATAVLQLPLEDIRPQEIEVTAVKWTVHLPSSLEVMWVLGNVPVKKKAANMKLTTSPIKYQLFINVWGYHHKPNTIKGIGKGAYYFIFFYPLLLNQHSISYAQPSTKIWVTSINPTISRRLLTSNKCLVKMSLSSTSNMSYPGCWAWPT